MPAPSFTGYTVTQMWSRDNGSLSTDDGQSWKGQFTTAYQVTHPKGADFYDILQHPDLPTEGEPFGDFSYVLCKTGKCQRVSPILTVITFDYEGVVGFNTGDGWEDSPLNQPPVISWTSQSSDEPVDTDWNGNPIVTPAYEPIDGVTMTIHDQVVTIKRNYLSISIPAIQAYLMSTNSDTFLDFAAGMGKFESYTATTQYTGSGQVYWEVTARIVFRYPYRTTPDKAWWARVRNEGHYTLQSGKWVRIKELDGTPVARPVCLDLSGQPLYDGTATWLEFQRYGSLPFAALGLV